MVVTHGGNSGAAALRCNAGVDTVFNTREADLAAYDALPPVVRRALRKLRSDWDARNAHEGLAVLGNPEHVAKLIIAEDAKNSRLWQTETFGEVYSDGVRTNDDDIIDESAPYGQANGRAEARAYSRAQSRH